ncbi:D-beta-D-heptose 7-phosphate kinase/D-beta-D-heptose 1-phosphate adenosyltransferase [Salinibacter ruber]|nr:D-beta-D-heptose 7-phosphate kinase/D-beta-D-heptose 1-phosphate adenosyltransferase [Salinibacter ruber]
MNLAGLGVETTLVGCVGKDNSADRLNALLREEGIQTDGLIRVSDRPTTTKTRVVGNRQQMLRLDEEHTHTIDEATVDRLVKTFAASLDDADAVVLSDYAKGVLPQAACTQLVDRAVAHECSVLVDPKGTDYRKYAGATAVTPNDRELSAATGAPPDGGEALLEAGQALRAELDMETLIVTRGEGGISRLSSDGHEHYPAVAQEVFDVSGAGDTVVATLAAGRAAGIEWNLSIRLANLAASVVIGKIGTAPITRDELADTFRGGQFTRKGSLIYDRKRIQEQVRIWKSQSETVVFTNGCFDILHAGHVTYLDKAKKEGDRLVVGLNTDRSVRALKGDPRPIVPEGQRARVLASLEAVDAVVLFDEETPASLIREVRPNVLVKGADYEKSEVVGASAVEGWGGCVELIPLVDGVSTTGILESVRTNDAES